MSAESIWVKRQDKVYGPFPPDKITAGFKSGKLSSNDEFSKSQAGPWKEFTALLVAGLGVANESGQRLHFPEVGFSISPLEKADHDGLLVLSMCLPTENGFAANVGVQIQQFEGDLTEYAELSRKQFDEAGADVKYCREGNDEWVCEYIGYLDERWLHCYSKALKQDHRIFLVTATAAEDQWDDVSAQLKTCVDSFLMD